MLEISGIQHDYVIEVFIPAATYEKPKFVEVLPEPQYLGAVRGYWKVHFEQDHLNTERSMGLMVIAQITGTSREVAENKSIALGEKMANLVALYAGSPYNRPLLRRLARIGSGGGILEQNVYYYLEERERLRQIQLKPEQLQTLLTRFGQLDATILQQLVLATRWGWLSILTPNDSMDSYLAAWIGLESIGPYLNSLYHDSGVKAACMVCGNEAGKDRDRKLAGIEHIIRLVAPEALIGRVLEDILRIRNEIAHGLKPAEELRTASNQLLPDLHVSLLSGILTGGGRGMEPIITLTSYLPRDSQVRPDARGDLTPKLVSLASRVQP